MNQHPKKSLYVTNLPASIQEADLRALFEAHGPVHAVQVVTNKMTGDSRGFGFVEMDSQRALDAIIALNHKEFCGQILQIDEVTRAEGSPQV